MSEELENTGEQNTENSTPQYTDIELKAMEMGWRPKEEFQGDEVDFIDAKEFVGRKPLYDKIASQSKQIKNVTEAVEALKKHYTTVQESEYKRALAALKSERRQALVEGDADKFESLDEKIKETEDVVADLKREAEKPIVKQEQAVHPEFAAWQNKNPWYSSTKYMREYADEVGMSFRDSGLTPAEVLKKVEEAVRKEFPQKFVNPNKQDAGFVAESRSGGKAPKTEDFQLTEQERKIMNDLIRMDPKLFTKEKYIADLKRAKGIK